MMMILQNLRNIKQMSRIVTKSISQWAVLTTMKIFKTTRDKLSIWISLMSKINRSQNLVRSEMKSSTQIFEPLILYSLFMGEYPTSPDEFYQLEKLGITGAMCISSDSDIQNLIEDQYVANESVHTLNEFNQETKVLKQVTCPIIPQNGDELFTLKLNFAITEIKNMILSDDLKVCVLYNPNEQQMAAEIMIGFMSKYCYYVDEHSLSLLKRIDEGFTADLARVNQAIRTSPN